VCECWRGVVLGSFQDAEIITKEIKVFHIPRPFILQKSVHMYWGKNVTLFCIYSPALPRCQVSLIFLFEVYAVYNVYEKNLDFTLC
jgi:hypothetical protein